MKTLIVFNHPYEGSFCNAILESVLAGLKKGGHETDVIHLDKDKFDPVMSKTDLAAFVKARSDVKDAMSMLSPQVLDYKKRLEDADRLVFIFPIWWELMPALTKGFIDKLIFPGIAYQYDENGKMKFCLNKLKNVTVITTMNTPSFLYRTIFGNAIKKSLLRGTFWKLGFFKCKWISLNMVKDSSEKKRKDWLKKIEKRFVNL